MLVQGSFLTFGEIVFPDRRLPTGSGSGKDAAGTTIKAAGDSSVGLLRRQYNENDVMCTCETVIRDLALWATGSNMSW